MADETGKAESEEKVILERIITLKQMLERDEDRPLDLHELGICYFHLKNYSQASEYLTQLLESYPDYLEISAVSTLKILCLVMDKKYDKSLDLIYERLEVEDQDTKLLAIMAYTYEKLDRMDEAINTHRRILTLEPENINSLNSLGYLMTMHGSEAELTEAFDYLKRALEKSPNHPAYLDSLGVHLAKRGKSDSARKALSRALRMEPRNMEILDHLKELLGV